MQRPVPHISSSIMSRMSIFESESNNKNSISLCLLCMPHSKAKQIRFLSTKNHLPACVCICVQVKSFVCVFVCVS